MNLNMEEGEIKKPSDGVVRSLIRKFTDRSSIGIKKYETTLDENKLSIAAWNKHLQEELMDACLYLEKLVSIRKKSVPQIEEIKKGLAMYMQSAATIRRGLDDLEELSSMTDLQPDVTDLIKGVKDLISNVEWQLDTIINITSSDYIRVLERTPNEQKENSTNL